jgi:hypothetical protein
MRFGRRRAQAEQTLFEALGYMRAELATRDAALQEMFERVIEISDRLFDYVEADRAERKALTTALDALTRSLSQPPTSTAPIGAPQQLIGGSFFGVGAGLPRPPSFDLTGAAPTTPYLRAVHDDAITVTPEHRVEVRCRFGDRWVDGFEVHEVIVDNDRLRYRLRRRADDSVLPTLFDADDVRDAREPRRGSASGGRPRWSYRAERT